MIVARWPEPPGIPQEPEAYLANVDRCAERDAYHSLTIEGYQVSPELIARVASGGRGDPEDKNRLATIGYLAALHRVREDLQHIFSGRSPAEVTRVGVDVWHQELFLPLAQAGLIEHKDLLGYRRQPVYIRGARHVPPRFDALPDAVDALFHCLEREDHAAVRAILGHFVFTWIHPYEDGNGRVARLLMNTQLASGGYPWTTLRYEDRGRYLSALDSASDDDDIRPFADYVREAMEAE